MPLTNFPHVRPTPMVLPTKDYPHLKHLMKEVDFACATCSSAQGQPVYYTLEEAHREPLSAGPTSHAGSIIAKGMIATRFLVLCPTCRTVPENNPLMPGGFCELLDIDPKYKRPARAQGVGGGRPHLRRPTTDEGSAPAGPQAHPVRLQAPEEGQRPDGPAAAEAQQGAAAPDQGGGGLQQGAGPSKDLGMALAEGERRQVQEEEGAASRSRPTRQ